MGRKHKSAKAKREDRRVRKRLPKEQREVLSKTKENYTVDQLLDQADECVDTFSYELAYKFCQRARALDPDNLRTLELSGSVSLELGDMDTAKQSFQRAVELSPDSGHSKYMYLGQLLTEHDAVACFQKGIELLKKELSLPKNQPDNGCEDDSGEKVGAEEGGACGAGASADTGAVAREKPVLTTRDLSNAYCSLAEIFLTDSCFEDSAEARCKETLQEAITADPTNPEAHHLEASFFLSIGDKKAAEESIQKGLSLWLPQLRDLEKPEAGKSASDQSDPVQVCQLSYPARVNAAKIVIELENFDTAIEICEQLLDEEDDVPEVWYLLGWTYYLQGEEDKGPSRQFLKKAQQVAAATCCEDEQLIQHIAELLQELGPDEEQGQGEDEEEDEDGDMMINSEDDSSDDEEPTIEMDH